ncbi:alpha-1,2-fucosyltransferase [Campylobacter mucosalis]|uniref:Alpha-1,2-fucosyltransferase n=1 Tax=Campylobacter mucosalis CCUG 21559 TaxID=1032067 RepID=A0A6G5QI55_9BACT|nr:alpha-1,2-fucosyltransferase [Campylobacter mucosalis]QCD45350.1 alpha-1,2-fucosyltransferase [Campylobacter mucosalis CCUG 21559]
MIIVKIVGGLGNQMFCYAYAKMLSISGYNVKIDTSVYKTYKLHGGYQLDKYNIDLDTLSGDKNTKFYSNGVVFKILKKFGLLKIKREESLLFDESFKTPNDKVYIEGYFQSEKYFCDIKDILLNQFVLKTTLSNYAISIKDKITQNSCSIHIRRGDYLLGKNINYHGVCDLKYYQDATDFLEQKCGDLTYFIFSDDIEWAKGNLKLNNAFYVDSSDRLPHEDIYLMSLCQNNIIANSTFSWWGAYLNQNQNKIVIAPKIWFSNAKLQSQTSDLIPNEWIRV